MRFVHLDVFSDRPYSGNSLTVFPEAAAVTAEQMGRITRELRHFESIFLEPEAGTDGAWAARVFDLMGELDFAGHPVIGAACALHGRRCEGDSAVWTMRLPARTVRVETRRTAPGRYRGVLDQGPAQCLGPRDVTDLLPWFSLRPEDLDPSLAAEVVSTGLRYLVLPVRGDALARARIRRDVQEPLARLGAQFAYLLDVDAMEGRHWNNDGVLEDVATGSAAGCVAAYLRRNARTGDGQTVVLHQGRFTGRPSMMTITAHGSGADIHRVDVGGDVVHVGDGVLRVLP